jgi:hypothetical protein
VKVWGNASKLIYYSRFYHYFHDFKPSFSSQINSSFFLYRRAHSQFFTIYRLFIYCCAILIGPNLMIKYHLRNLQSIAWSKIYYSVCWVGHSPFQWRYCLNQIHHCFFLYIFHLKSSYSSPSFFPFVLIVSWKDFQYSLDYNW